MDQDTAYRMMMGFAGRLRVKAMMQKTIEGDWDVTVKTPGHTLRHLGDRDAGRAFYRQLQAEGHPRP